jgi:hypothetical protein
MQRLPGKPVNAKPGKPGKPGNAKPGKPGNAKPGKPGNAKPSLLTNADDPLAEIVDAMRMYVDAQAIVDFPVHPDCQQPYYDRQIAAKKIREAVRRRCAVTISYDDYIAVHRNYIAADEYSVCIEKSSNEIVWEICSSVFRRDDQRLMNGIWDGMWGSYASYCIDVCHMRTDAMNATCDKIGELRKKMRETLGAWLEHEAAE